MQGKVMLPSACSAHTQTDRGVKKLCEATESSRHGGHRDCKGYKSSHHFFSQVAEDDVEPALFDARHHAEAIMPDKCF